MRLSYSQVSTYQRCPHQYELQYVQSLPAPKPGELLLGNAVHQALKFMHAPGHRQIPAVDEVIGEFCRAWKGLEDNIPEPERTPLFEEGVDMLRQYQARESARQERRQTAAVERFFSLPFGEGHTLRGVIDRIDVRPGEAIEVLDYKTGRAMPTQIEVNRNLQLAIYRMATEEALFPGKSVTTSLYYLRHGATMTAEIAPEQMEEMKAEVSAVIAGIEKGEFSPRVDRHCDWCDYRNNCIVFRPVVVPAEAKADIEAWIKEFAQAEDSLRVNRAEEKRLGARKAELETAILGWMEEAGTGFYETGGVQAIKGVSSRTSFPPEKVRPLLEPLGLWEKVCKFSVTKTAIDNLCRAEELSPDQKRELLSTAEKTEKAVVKLRRLGEGAEEDADGDG